MAENTQEPILKAILTRVYSPLEKYAKRSTQFSFECVDENEILKEILNLDASKSYQDSDTPSTIIKENVDIFINSLYSSFNNSIYQSEFPWIFNLGNIDPVFKKGDKNSKENYRPVSILPNISKSLDDAYFVKFPFLWISIYQSNNVGSEKVTAHGLACWWC